MLLAGLQSEAVSRVAVHVNRHAHQAAGHRAFELITTGQVRSMRATGTHGHTKALGGADHDVCTPLAGRRQQRECQRVCGCDECGLLGVYGCHVGAQVVNTATGGWVLCQHGKVLSLQGGMPFRRRVGQQHGDAQRLGAGLNHLNRLRMAVTCHHKSV